MTEERIMEVSKSIAKVSIEAITPAMQEADDNEECMRILKAMVRANFLAGFSGAILMMDQGEDMDDIRNGKAYTEALKNYKPLLEALREKTDGKRMRPRKEIDEMIECMKLVIDYKDKRKDAYHIMECLQWVLGDDKVGFAEFAKKAMAKMHELDSDDDPPLDSGNETTTAA